MTVQESLEKRLKAPELLGNYWFNGGPVSVNESRGDVLLIEFWDYTCAYCERALPYIKEWYSRYHSMGLTVVGVHTPKFPFGRDPKNVDDAIRGNSIEYPVVMDNDALIWGKYAIQAWPTMVLVDRDGVIRYQNIGDSDYLTTERLIQKLLHERGVEEELPMLMEPLRVEDRPGMRGFRTGSELFSGYQRGSLGNVEGYVPEAVVTYGDPRIYFSGRFYAAGQWMNGRNSLQLSDDTDTGGVIILRYEGTEVDAVLKAEAEQDVEVTVTQDDKYLTDRNKGNDIVLGSDGRSFLVIDAPRLYHVVKNLDYGEHVLRFTMSSNSFAMYSLTFIPGILPELISKN